MPSTPAAPLQGRIIEETRKRNRTPKDNGLGSQPNTFDDHRSLKHARTKKNGAKPLENGATSLPNSTAPSPAFREDLSALYSESVCAKIWGVAGRALNKSIPPTLYPEYTKPGATNYVYRDAKFWTSGFFPGSIYLLLERQRKYAQFLSPSPDSGLPPLPHPLQLQYACEWWTVNLHKNASVTDTHDLGFMISPWARKAWELDHDPRAYDTLITAAKTLAARFNNTVGSLRSWDTCITKRYSFTDPSADFLVIIDNMLNLDLLFWAATELRSHTLRAQAIAHAKTSQRYHIRNDNSTFHVVNFDQETGEPKEFLTNQGYDDNSCWSRGQAWAITGFAQTYHWTHDISFLETSRKCADYFLENLPSSGVPYWDFTAPVTDDTPTDTSAAMIATYGMLLLHQGLTGLGMPSPYLKGALHILQSVCATKMAPPASFYTSVISLPSVGETGDESGPLEVDMGEGAETILLGATINNFKFAPRRWADHGLVYADYYFLLVGNKLLDMGIGGSIAELVAEP